MESFALNDIVNHEVERFRFLHNNLIHVNAESDALIHGDYQMITALVSNLLDNAAKYGGAGEIQVQLKCEKNQVILKVSDSGVGIPETEKSKIFDRFYRIGNEDTRSAKGTGLGLFICSNVVKLHHGRIHVTDNHPNGSIFVVTFPSSIK
jgi:signal transduction histidine kinase